MIQVTVGQRFTATSSPVSLSSWLQPGGMDFRRTLLAAALILASLAYAQDRTIPPNDALVLENVPSIPASVAENADRYTQYRTALMWDWHPQRREILMGTRFGDTVQVHEVAVPGGARTQLTFFADRVAEASYRRTTGSTSSSVKILAGASGTRFCVSMLRMEPPPCSPTASRATPNLRGRIAAIALPMPAPGATTRTSTFT